MHLRKKVVGRRTKAHGMSLYALRVAENTYRITSIQEAGRVHADNSYLVDVNGMRLWYQEDRSHETCSKSLLDFPSSVFLKQSAASFSDEMGGESFGYLGCMGH
jgi:hypothetical protein